MGDTAQITITIWGLWIQSGALVLSILGVMLTLWHRENVAKKRAALDFILVEQTDHDAITQRNDFVRLRDGKESLVQFSRPEFATGKENQTIRAVLNRYELVAIGIKVKTVDESSYKDWFRSTLVADWRACKPYLTELRRLRRNPKIFCELEALAKKWANKTERPHV